MTEQIEIGPLPGTYFCARCDRNRWFAKHSVCQFCGGRKRETAAPGGLNPPREQLAAMQRRQHADPLEALVAKMERLGLTTDSESR